MTADDAVLRALDFETPRVPVIMCDGKAWVRLPDGTVLDKAVPCPDAARHALTCTTCCKTIYLCSAHRMVAEPASWMCGATWYEQVIG